MDQTYVQLPDPRDLRVRPERVAPITKTLMELATNPGSLRSDLFADHRRPWYAIPCGDGAWLANWLNALNAYNAGGTDALGALGTVSTIAQFIRTNDPSLGWLQHQLKFAHEHHGIKGVQIITHPLCGGTKEEVCGLISGASEVYAHPRKVKAKLFFATEKLELEIHRRDLDFFTDWVFETFPFIDAIEYLRGTKWRLEPFSHHEIANCRAIEVLKERNEWED